MAYPESLSEKSLKKLYLSIGISEEAIKALSDFFDVCSELYGCISLGNAWDLYKRLMQEQSAPQIHRKDLYRYAQIATRDKKSYRIYEDTEIWSDGDGAVSWTMLINGNYIGVGKYKFSPFYTLYDAQMNKPFFLPENFLHYLEKPMIKEEEQLLRFLEGLKVTAEEVKLNGKTRKCENRGQYLKDFKFYNAHEEFSIKYFSGQLNKENVRKTADKKMLARIEKEVCENEALKIVRIIREASDTGAIAGHKMNPFQKMFDELNEVGVELNDRQVSQLSNLASNFINRFNHRTNRGWAPVEMPIDFDPTKPIHMKFGPGMMKAMNSGELDKEEIISALIDQGIIPEFD